MKRGQVRAMTLAELAFTVLFCLAIVLLPNVDLVSNSGRYRDAERRATEAEAAREKAEKEREAAEKRAAEAEERANGISDIWPNCPGGYLFTAVLLGSDSFELSGETLSSQEVAARFKATVERGEQEKCRYLVRLLADAGTDYGTYQSAVSRLERLFRVRGVLRDSP